MSNMDDFPTLVSSLQASTVEWNLLGSSFRLTSPGSFSGVNMRNKYLRFMQLLHEIEELFSIYRLSPSSVLIAWCASLQESAVAPHFVGLLVDLTLQGNLPYLALRCCLRLVDVFLDWTTQPNAGSGRSGDAAGSHAAGVSGASCPVLIPSYTVAKWVEQTWTSIQNLSRDTAGTSTPTATAGLCGALQLLPVLLRWSTGPSPLPAFRRGQLPHPVNMQSEEVRLLAFRTLPFIVRHQPDTVAPQSYAHEIIEYVRRGCVKSSDIFVRIAAGASLRGALESGLRVSSPAVAYALMDMLLCLCDDVAPFDVSDEVLHDVGVAMGYLFAFYQSDFTVDSLGDVWLAAAAPQPKTAAAAAEDRTGAGSANVGRLRWKYFGGSDAVEGSRVVQRCFNERMTRTAQRALATALATLCSSCSTPATTASVIQCCFVLLMPMEGDARAYMPRLLADAIREWAQELPSNGYRVVLADVLRGYVQRSSEDRAVARTAMVALHGVVRTLSSSLEIGFNVANDVLAAVNATPSLLHTGVEVLAAVARTNTLYARQLQHQCARAGRAEVANTLTFQLHVRALLDASANTTEAASSSSSSSNNSDWNEMGFFFNSEGKADVDDALGEEDRVSLVHVCIRLLLRLSRGDPPQAVQDIHYRQAELIFRLTQLIYDLLRGSPVAVVHAARDELQPCTLGFMNLLVSSPAPSIAFYKAVTAACEMLRRAPLVSDTERMLAVGFLESRLASRDGVARRNVGDAAGSVAATAYFTVSKGALYHLVACAPWLTCRDDGSLRWLAAQALKDVARACASVVPVLSFAEIHGAAVASAAQSMRLVRTSLLCPYVSSSAVSAAAETPAHPREECGRHAVRLLRWTLQHFMSRGDVPVCVSLLASLYTDLYKVYAIPVKLAATVEEQAQQAVQREMGLWNSLGAVHELLLEAAPHSAAALWANAKWKAEVKRWHAVAAQLVPATSQESVEVRLLAAKVLALCLVSTEQVDVFTSQTVAAVAQGSPNKDHPMDSLGALMVLCEAHSHVGDAAAAAAAASGTQVVSSPTLPLATSLLSEVWRRLAGTAVAASAAFSFPVLILLSLRLAQVYPAEVEVALSDNVVGVLLTPMSANSQWWSGTSAMGVLTAVVQLWSVFGGVNAAVTAVPQTSALLLVQESLFAVTQRHLTPTATLAAALNAVDAFTRHQAGDPVRSVAWRRLLHLCLEHTTHIQREEVCVSSPLVQQKGRSSLRRLVVQSDNISLRLARLWYRVLHGSGSGATPLIACAVADASATRRLTMIDVAIQVDVATAAAVRRGWVTVAQALSASLLPHNSLLIDNTTSPTSTTVPSLTPAFKSFLDAVHAILQSRSPDVQTDIAKRDTDMFAAVNGEAADDVRGGGGGSDDVDDYAEEFGGEGLGGILSEAGGGGDDRRGGNGPATSATDATAFSAAAPTFDVAAKEAAMWVLYGVLLAVGSKSARRVDEARWAVLPMVVAAAQLVEVHPEVHVATTAVLHEVLALWGDVTQVQGQEQEELARPLSVLAPWKTQLVVSVTTVLQHGLLSLEGCTALAVQFSRCRLADISSCRRVLRSLLLLLHACHRLQDRHRAFLLGGSGGAGHIIVAIAKVAQSPAMAAEKLEAAQEVFVRTLVSPPCQAALTLLCERFVTAVSLANGYVPPTSAFGLGWGEDDDGEGGSGEDTAATASVYGSRMSMTANDVLQAVAFTTEPPLRATMGPALRYATGCLACLVLVTLVHPAPTTATQTSNNSDEALRFVVALSGKLTLQHRRILAQLAQQRLVCIVASWDRQSTDNCGENNASANGVKGEADKWRESTALLRIAAAASMPHAQAEELLLAFAPYVVASNAKAAGSRRVEMTASLLCVGLAAKLGLKQLHPLLRALSAEALTAELSPSIVTRLQQLTAVYVQGSDDDRVRALALAGPVGLMLVGRCVSIEALPVERSPFLQRLLWPAVLELLQRAMNPLRAIEYIWSPPPPALTSTADESSPHAALRECVEDHTAETDALLALFAAIDNSPPATNDAGPTSVPSLMETATFVLHCGPLLCGLLLTKVKTNADPTAAAAESLHEVLLYVVTLLSTQLGPAYAVALNDVGRYLVRTVAPVQGPALREAIHRLGASKASQLRVFMEESCS